MTTKNKQAARAKRGEPVRIRRPEICKLACKAKGERIFTEGEIPGSDFENSFLHSSLFTITSYFPKTFSDGFSEK